MAYEKAVKTRKLINKCLCSVYFKSSLDFTCEKYFQFHANLFYFVTCVHFD